MLPDDDVSDRSSPDLLNIANDPPPSPQRVTKKKGISKRVSPVKENQEDENNNNNNNTNTDNANNNTISDNTLIMTSLNPREVFILIYIYIHFFIIKQKYHLKY